MTTIYDQNSMLLNTDGVVAGTPFKRMPINVTLANGGTFDFPAVAGHAVLSFLSGGSLLSVVKLSLADATGTVYLHDVMQLLKSGGYDITDTNTANYICIYDNGANARIINNNAWAVDIQVVGEFWYR